MTGLLETLGAKTLAGFIGGVLALRFFEGLTPTGKAWTVAGGMAMAYFVTHPVIDFFVLKPHYEGAVGFVVGLFGMSIAAALFSAVKQIELARIVASWIERR